MPFRDDTSIGTASEFAQRADTILDSIRFSDPIKAYGPVRAAILAAAKERGKEGLARMAKETGGKAFEVAHGRSIDEIYQEIEDALRNQYSLGYTPERAGNPGGSYHKINLRAKNRHLVVRTREGYYAR